MLKDYLYPETAVCIGCGTALPPSESSLCPECRKALISSAYAFLPDTRNRDVPEAFSAWLHSGLPRHLVHQLKHSAISKAADEMAPFLVYPAQSAGLTENTVITWVPMPESRRRDRCIDHSQRLAAALARELDMDIQPLLIRKDNHRHTQRGLGRRARLQNLQNAFESIGPVDRPVLLVDDVITTGSTIRACMDALLSAGAPAVHAVTATSAMKSGKAPSRKAFYDILIDIPFILAILYVVYVYLIGG